MPDPRQERASALVIVSAFLDAGDLGAARDYIDRLTDDQRATPLALRLQIELLMRENKTAEVVRLLDEINPDRIDSPTLRALVDVSLARLDLTRGNAHAAIDRLTARLATDGHALNAADRSIVHGWLATCYSQSRDFSRSRDHHEVVLQCAEEVGDPVAATQGLLGLARCERSLGLWDRAIALMDRARHEAEKIGNPFLLQRVVSNLASTRLFVGQFETSRRLFRSHLALTLENKDAARLPLVHAALGLLHTRTREWEPARSHLAIAHRLAERGHLTRPLALSCEYLGELALSEGRIPRAKRWLRQAIRIAEPAGLRDVVGEATCRMAEVELLEGDADAALVTATRCLADFESMQDFYEIAVSRRVVGQILLALGRRAEALVELDRALTAFQSLSEQFESRRVKYLQEAAARGDVVLNIREALADVESAGGADHSDNDIEPSSERSDSISDGDGNVDSEEGSSTELGGTVPTVSSSPATSRRRRRGHHPPGEPTHHPDFPELLGRSAALLRVLEQAKTFARAEAPVLLEGETGTGKELVARAIHRLSARGDGPFVPFNCGTSTPEMLDSELFGHERGAFTGAAAARAGLVRKASHGTLFLDEIAELPSNAQPRLLRLVDSGELRSVGSDDFEHVDIRLLSATHQDLSAAVTAGRFREDLLFRLSTFRVRLPALRHRLDDLSILVDHFTKEARRRGYPEFAGLNASVLERMATYTWPGNLRELRNEIFRLAGAAPTGRLVTEWTRPNGAEDQEERVIDRAAVLAAIEDAQGNLTIAARHLGISRGRLYRRLAGWGIDPMGLRG